MNTLKKITCLVMAILMILTLAACGTKQPVAPDGTDTAVPQVKSDEKITLTFWHVFTSEDHLRIIDEYIKDFNKEYPNVKVEQVYVNDEEYVTKLRVAAATGSQGDVFFAYGSGQAQPYVESGVVMKLDDYYASSKLKDRLLGGTLTYCTYNDGIYGIPLKQWAGVLYCNTALFDQYNVKIPETWDEMETAIATFKANGITPLAVGGADAWHIAMYQNALAVRFAGPDYCNSMLSGEATFVTDEIVKSAQTVIDLYNEGAFTPNTLGYSAEEAEAEFFMGNVAMFYGGSWSCMDIDRDGAATKGNCTVTALPTVAGGKGDEKTFSGGVIDFLMINENTKNPDIAFAFASGVAERMSIEFYKIGDSLPAWSVDGVDVSQVSPTLRQIQALTADASGYVLAWDTFLDGSVTDVHYNLLQGLFTGEVTAEAFAQGMQDAMDAFLATK